ncbi:MAG: protoporphyrinogen oxidase, partial [Terriglobia bacterium]
GLMFFVPTRPWSAISSPLFSTGSKLAILHEFLRQPWHGRLGHGSRNRKAQVSEDESVASFVRRHFGAGLLETVVQPLVAGVYGAEPEHLSARAVLPRFLALEREHGSIIRGALKERNRKSDEKPMFTTLREGLEGLVEALSANLSLDSPQPRRQLRQKVVEIAVNGAGGSYSIRCESGAVCQADAVILALPACHCATILRPLHEGIADLLAGIPYSPAVTAALGFRVAPDLPPGFGFLVPRREGSKLLACTFVHSKFPGRAPAGDALLRCFLGGSRNSEVIRWSDEEVIAAVTSDLRAALGLSKQPEFYRIFRWPHALPQYLVGHEQRVQAIQEKVKTLPGLFLAGNAYAGLGIPDCIRSGQAAAANALLYRAPAR